MISLDLKKVFNSRKQTTIIETNDKLDSTKRIKSHSKVKLTNMTNSINKATNILTYKNKINSNNIKRLKYKLNRNVSHQLNINYEDLIKLEKEYSCLNNDINNNKYISNYKNSRSNNSYYNSIINHAKPHVNSFNYNINNVDTYNNFVEQGSINSNNLRSIKSLLTDNKKFDTYIEPKFNSLAITIEENFSYMCTLNGNNKNIDIIIDKNTETNYVKTIEIYKEYVKSTKELYNKKLKEINNKYKETKSELMDSNSKVITLLKDNSRLKLKILDIISKIRDVDSFKFEQTNISKVRLNH